MQFYSFQGGSIPASCAAARVGLAQGSVYFPTLTSVDVSAHVKTEPVLTYSIARVRICLGLYLHTLRSGGASAAAVHTLLVLHRSGASTGNFAAPSARPTVMILVNVFTTKNAARHQF